MEALCRNLPEVSFYKHEELLCPQHSSRDSKQHFRHIVQSALAALKCSITYFVINSNTCSSLGQTNIFKLFRKKKMKKRNPCTGAGLIREGHEESIFVLSCLELFSEQQSRTRLETMCLKEIFLP